MECTQTIIIIRVRNLKFTRNLKFATSKTLVNFMKKIANLISKLNFYKVIPYPMDNCFTGRRDRSRQTPEKDVLYIIPAGPVSSVHLLGGTSYLLPVQRE